MLPPADRNAILENLGVILQRRTRPVLAQLRRAEVEIRLRPRAPGTHVVSFGLPFAPGDLDDDGLIRILDGDVEVPVYTEPLARWGIDRDPGTCRSILVQFELHFEDASDRIVTAAWTSPRKRSRSRKVPIPETQTEVPEDGFIHHRPTVLALLPPDWLCGSLIAWQQVPAAENDVAEWFDRHLLEQFPGSLDHIASTRYAPHLYDRPATYAKIYIRHGEEAHLDAALRAADFYVSRIGEDGFFALKPGDFKYVYAEGPALLYLLTGDTRYRDAVLRGLDAWSGWTHVRYTGEGFWTERHTAFGMAAYLHAYELTGDTALLDRAMPFFDGVHALQVAPMDGGPPDGAWLHTAESHGDGNGWTTSPWMSALLMDSIWKLWMLTGDERCPESLAMYAKFIDRHAVTADRKRLYYMANSPGRGESVNPEHPPHHLEACYMLAMGYYLSGGRDASLLATLDSLWPELMDDDANAPPRKFAWRFRETSMLVWFLTRAAASP